ncbi:TPA: lysis protein [Escherichia coli]|nr:lysis protein [Escherichia coli]
MQSPLRNVRKAHGFTLQHVAAGVQVNPATLSRIERLEQIPSIELAERLANFFKGEVSEMQILYPARFQSSQNQNGFKPQEATTASGVDNAASPRLADTAERDYFTLRERLITMQKQLEGTQKYINEQCR